jgi:hypothetical protein
MWYTSSCVCLSNSDHQMLAPPCSPSPGNARSCAFVWTAWTACDGSMWRGGDVGWDQMWWNGSGQRYVQRCMWDSDCGMCMCVNSIVVGWVAVGAQSPLWSRGSTSLHFSFALCSHESMHGLWLGHWDVWGNGRVCEMKRLMMYFYEVLLDSVDANC